VIRSALPRLVIGFQRTRSLFISAATSAIPLSCSRLATFLDHPVRLQSGLQSMLLNRTSSSFLSWLLLASSAAQILPIVADSGATIDRRNSIGLDEVYTISQRNAALGARTPEVREAQRPETPDNSLAFRRRYCQSSSDAELSPKGLAEALTNPPASISRRIQPRISSVMARPGKMPV